MLRNRLIISKLKTYLGDYIRLYNANPFQFFLKVTAEELKSDNPENILKLFYFDKFYDTLKNDDKITLKNDLNENFIPQIRKKIIENFINPDPNNKAASINVYNFMKKYGNINKQLLKDLYLEYIKVVDEDLFMRFSKIFLLNSYKDDDWESLFKIKLGSSVSSLNVKDSLSMKVLIHVYKDEIDKISNIRNQVLKVNMQNKQPTSTRTQIKIKHTLNKFKIKYVEEYVRDGYTYDYYLPELDSIIEYDGPEHFYPLQTQLAESVKFRYRNINENFKSKLISIPYFEYMRFDITELTEFYLKQLIYQDYKLTESALFEENFDFFKIIREYQMPKKSLNKL